VFEVLSGKEYPPLIPTRKDLMRTTPLLNRRRRTLRAGLAVLVLSGVAAVLIPAGPALARPRRADIAVTGMTASPAEAIMGDFVDIRVDVANVGRAVSGAVIVSVTLPATMQSRSDGASSETWDCYFIAPSWRCTHAALAPGEVAEGLYLSATVVGGTPGDVLTVTAEASTTSRELSAANNTGRADVNLIAAGTIRGKVWVDEDRDGQRDPGEPGLAGQAYGFYGLRLNTEDGAQSIQAVVDDEGNYSVAVRPNRYIVEVAVYVGQWAYTTPNSGDEATDSDVVLVYSDDVSALARSGVIEVTGGSESVVDVGVTYAAVA
jgi:hypothetical protein